MRKFFTFDGTGEKVVFVQKFENDDSALADAIHLSCRMVRLRSRTVAMTSLVVRPRLSRGMVRIALRTGMR